MNKKEKLQVKIDKFLNEIPKEYKYWKNLEHNENLARRNKKWWRDIWPFDFERLNPRLEISGFLPIFPDYEAISKDYPKFKKLVKRLNAL